MNSVSSPRSFSPRRILVLGPGDGWHADQLRQTATAHGHLLDFADYESLTATIDSSGDHAVACEAGAVGNFDAILMRTMPPGSLEQITFRLAILHRLEAEGMPVINSPRSLEVAIDKYATLAVVSRLGYDVPPTIVVQSRREAMNAFHRLGGDCVLKPLFGGEGRGVMRISDEALAWTAFSTLEQLAAICYVQQFIPPGGRDLRLFVIGDDVWGVRRESTDDWRTNVSHGARCAAVPINDCQREMALNIAHHVGLEIGSVDLIDADDGPPRVLEVNGVPGWKGAQAALEIHLADQMMRHIVRRVTLGSVRRPLVERR